MVRLKKVKKSAHFADKQSFSDLSKLPVDDLYPPANLLLIF